MKRKNRGSIIVIMIIMIVSLSTPQIICTLDSEDEDMGAPLGPEKKFLEVEILLTITVDHEQILFKFWDKEDNKLKELNPNIDLLEVHQEIIIEDKNARINARNRFYLNIKNYSNFELKEVWWYNSINTKIQKITECSLEMYNTFDELILKSDDYSVDNEENKIIFNISKNDLISIEKIPSVGHYTVIITYNLENIVEKTKEYNNRVINCFEVTFFPPEFQVFDITFDESEDDDLIFDKPESIRYGERIWGIVGELNEKTLEIEYSRKMGPIEETSREWPKYVIGGIVGFIIAQFSGFLKKRIWKKHSKKPVKDKEKKG